MGVHQVGHQIQISMYWLVLSQLRLNAIQPVHQGLESLCKLAGEKQGLL